jgi:prolyl 4-hydroxylase
MGKASKFGGSLTAVLVLALVYLNWEHLNEKFQLTVATRSLADLHGTKSITLYKNGYSTGGVPMQLSADLLHAKSGRELAEHLSQFIEVETIKTPDSVPVTALADRVYNGNGKLLDSFADIRTGDRLYLVAEGLHFVFPFVKLGHRVYVEPQDNPTGKPVIIESLSEVPRTFHLHNFFSYEEADRLIERILEIDDETNKLQQSAVGHLNGKKLKSPHRTSENAFDQVSDAAIRIRKRVFDVLSLGEYHPDMCDGLQLLRYKQKQAYIAHTDYFEKHTTQDWNWDPSEGGSNRFATVFLYLSNVTRGGQTVFPLADMPEGLPASYDHPADVSDYQARGAELFEPESWEADMVNKCSTKLAAYPRKAHAVLFYSQKPNGELDPMSLHGGCPVLDGTKWGANLWVWNKRRFGLDDDGTTSRQFTVIFQNPSDREVDLYWSSTKMTSIPPHGKTLYTTFKEHKWTIKHGDRVLLEFMGSPEDGDSQTVFVPLENEEPVLLPPEAETPMETKDEL